MSRLAVLSSKPQHYLEAIEDLKSLYIARGYPIALVNKWTKDNLSKRWDLRHSESKASGEVFVLKSHYNPVWSSFDIQKLGNIIKESWRSSLYSFAVQPQETFQHTDEVPEEPRQGTTSPSPSPQPSNRPFNPPELVQQQLDDMWSRPRRPGPALTPRTRALEHTTPVLSSQPDLTADRDKNSNGTLRSTLVTYSHTSDSPEALSTRAELDKASESLVFTGRFTRLGGAKSLEAERVLNIESLGYFDKRWLVSRKRNTNLGDLVNQWKKTVINKHLNDGPAIAESLDEWRQ